MKPEQERAVAGDIKAINALRGQLIAAYNSNDAAATAAFYADDAIVTPPNQAAIAGKHAIRTWYEAIFKENAVKIALTPLETQVTGDWAYERGKCQDNRHPKVDQADGAIAQVLCDRQAAARWLLEGLSRHRQQ